MRTLAQLDADLDALRQTLPEPGSEGERTFDFDAFQRKVDELVATAEPADQHHLRERAECMLGSAGLIPSDNEGEPCP
jgi:hypothetical protein